MCRETNLYVVFILAVLLGHQQLLLAQKDSLPISKLDSLLRNQKGIIGELAENLFVDTADNLKTRQRNDAAYQQYRGRIIRHITIQSLDFGISIGDTNKVLNNRLTRLANDLHKQTRKKVILQNLFFKQNDKLSPFLLGDNERYLRDLPYLQDARIKVQPVQGSKDSVDVLVLTKDVFSVGGSLRIHNTKSAAVNIREDNFYGLGDRLQFQMLYDQDRHQHMGYGFEYIRRNIGGTFIDGAAGYLNFEQAFNSGKAEERMTYVKFSKQLVNPYMRWTYGLDARWNATRNMYAADSFYMANLKYRANSIDVWSTLNNSAGQIAGKNEDNRLRMALSFRFLNQHFMEKPLQYSHQYYFAYANQTAILGALSFFKQNFYKIQYLYGFGRPEDVPQGMDATLTLGWTVKDQRKRPYMAIGLQRFFFTASEQHFNYTIQAESFFHKHHFEDLNLVARINFINYLHHINGQWKQRTFLNAEFVQQFNSLLQEPVFSDKLFGAIDISEHPVAGNLRATISGESVFYSPWSVLYFRMAPYAFGAASLFRYANAHDSKVDLYTAMGGGIRFRNESLIFGTMDLKALYFPKKNINNEHFAFEFNTKVRFTYDQKLNRRPEFIQVN